WANAVGTGGDGAASARWKRSVASSASTAAATAATANAAVARRWLRLAEVKTAMLIGVEALARHQLWAERALEGVRDPCVGGVRAVGSWVGPVGDAMAAHAAREAEQRSELGGRRCAVIRVRDQSVVERLARVPRLRRNVETAREDRLSARRDLRVG